MILEWKAPNTKKWHYSCHTCDKDIMPFEIALRLTSDIGIVYWICNGCITAIKQCPTIG